MSVLTVPRASSVVCTLKREFVAPAQRLLRARLVWSSGLGVLHVRNTARMRQVERWHLSDGCVSVPPR
jgi:hypothetical protein